MPAKPERLPPSVLRILRLLANPDVVSGLAGDLEEEYADIRGRRGAVPAAFWLWFQILISFPSFVKSTLIGRPAMFVSYLRSAWRSLTKHKVFSFINIAGLSVGLACCILISAWIAVERGYDGFHENGSRLYQVLVNGSQPDNPSTPFPLGPALEAEIPEVERAVRFDSLGPVYMRYQERTRFETDVVAADPAFFRVFSFPFADGDPDRALADPASAVISSEVAAGLFAGENPLGKTIQLDGRDFKVTGVLAASPGPSTLGFQVAVPFQQRIEAAEAAGLRLSWGNWIPNTFLLAKPGIDAASLGAKIETFMLQKAPQEEASLSLIPFPKRRLFFSNIGQYMTLFGLIAAFVLAIAVINYINLTTARAVVRSREIGLRKVVGARRRNIIGQVLGESLFLAVFSVGCGFGLAFLALPWFNTIAPSQVVLDPIRLLPALAGLAVLTGLAAGFYPSLVLSETKPLQALRARGRFGGARGRLRQGLVVFQFLLSILIIIGSMVVFRQVRFMRNKDLGYDRQHLLALSLPAGAGDPYEILKEKLRGQPGIRDVSGTAANMTNLRMSTSSVDWEGKDPGREILVSINETDYDLDTTFGFAMASGRFFSREHPSDEQGVVINESFERLMGGASAVGRAVTLRKERRVVLGVVKDFHFQSLRTRIEPLALTVRPDHVNLGYVRLSGDGGSGSLERIRTVWESVFPDYPFRYRFVNETLDSFYAMVRRTGQMAAGFLVMALFIGCLGMLGLSSFLTEQRSREIGIRKILGASRPSLLLRLNRESLACVLLANVFAWPAAYWVMRDWVGQFAYRIRFGLDVCLIAAVIALGAALLAVGVQTYKAASRNPIASIRYE